MKVLTSHLTDSLWHGAVSEPENVKWPNKYLRSLFSLFPLSVSHSGNGWLFSQQSSTAATWPVIYSQMTQMSHIGTWQDPQLETPLPSSPITGDAVAEVTGLCWHHRIWSDLPWRPNPQYAHDLTPSEACDTLSVSSCVLETPAEWSVWTKHTHAYAQGRNDAWVRKSVRLRLSVFYYCITRNQHRSIMTWTLVSCKPFYRCAHMLCGQVRAVTDFINYNVFGSF